MGQVSAVLRRAQGGFSHWCPGCEEMHLIPDNWAFDGNVAVPTFTPSVKITYRHPKGYTNDNPAPLGWKGEYVEEICHYILTAGQLQFCSDCTHALADKTVPLPPLPSGFTDA